MAAPRSGDVVIRDIAPGEFEVADAISFARLAGPFRSIREAADLARQLKPLATIFREIEDGRGRSLGPLFRLSTISDIPPQPE